MKKIFNISAIAAAFAMLLGLASCAPEELSTDQFSDDAVTFAAFAPNPVARGGALRITGSNLQKVTEVILPGIDPVRNIEVVKEGRYSEIRVTVPKEGPEVGPISIVADGQTLTSIMELSYTESIEFDDFSPKKAMPGDVITFKGDYLSNIRMVQFEGCDPVTEFVSQSRYELKVAVPSEIVTGKIIISDVDENNNPDGLVANLFYSTEDLVIGDPKVVSKDRDILKVGARVLIQGEYLNMIEHVYFGGVEAEFEAASNGEQIGAFLPATAVDGEITLVSYAGTELKAGSYTTLVPSSLSIAPETRYKAGLKVTVKGHHLDIVTGADLAGTACDFTATEDELTFTIPAAAADGVVTLTLANGKTVATEAIELVKPVVTEVTPLELMAGEEITVKGTDLDLVVSATLGGKDLEMAYAEEVLTLTTNNTSVSGKIVLKLANGVAVEPSEEIVLSYDSFIVVNEMPTAEHIGATVTLKGENFMMIENIYIGDVKVEQYVSRADDQISFIMPWNKIGTYSMKFQLLTGEEEICPTSIEVLLELKITTAWEGSVAANWDTGERIYIPAKYFEGVKPGAILRVSYTQNDSEWHQGQFNNAAWSATLAFDSKAFPEPGKFIPTDLHGWDVFGSWTDDLVLSAETLENILTNQGVVQEAGTTDPIGIIIQGDGGITYTKFELVEEISQEMTVWEGDVLAGNWSGTTVGEAGMFRKAGLKPGMKVRIYIEPGNTTGWQFQVYSSSWEGIEIPGCQPNDKGVHCGFTVWHHGLTDGHISFIADEAICNALLDIQLLFNGDGDIHYKKITIE